MKIVPSEEGAGVLVLLDDGTDITGLIDLNSISVEMEQDGITIKEINLHCGTEGLYIEPLKAEDYSDDTDGIMESTTLN